MSFQIDKRFVVKAPALDVWAFLTDPRRVANALPGAAVTEQIDDRTYAGTVAVKVGPVTASYKGTMRFERLDAAARAADIVATGQDVRGKGGASMKMASHLSEIGPGETEAVVSAELNVTGALAQFGRGMIQDVGDQLFERFTESMRGELEARASPAGAPAAAPAAPEPVDLVALGAGAAARAAGRSLRRPGFWVAVGVLVLIVLWLLARAH